MAGLRETVEEEEAVKNLARAEEEEKQRKLDELLDAALGGALTEEELKKLEECWDDAGTIAGDVGEEGTTKGDEDVASVTDGEDDTKGSEYGTKEDNPKGDEDTSSRVTRGRPSGQKMFVEIRTGARRKREETVQDPDSKVSGRLVL